jgi:hypothetical protein
MGSCGRSWGEGGQLAAAEAGHHGVGDEQGDVLDGFEHGPGFEAVGGFEHRVAELGELLADDLAHFGFVLDQQHQPVSLATGRPGGGGGGRRGGLSVIGTMKRTLVPLPGC